MLISPIIVKVGGSLLDLPGLGLKLRAWLDALPKREVILIAGGGAAAEVIRRLDQVHHLGDEPVHWLAIRAMSLNSHVLADLLSRSVVVESLEACAGLELTAILDPLRFMKDCDLRPERLPPSWSVTSDSIAARVALATAARELILLKSRAPQPGRSWNELVQDGLVDEHFPALARLIPSVRIVNFREDLPPLNRS